MTKKKLLAISLATAMAISVVSCGSKEALPNATESETTVVESSESVETSETLESLERVTEDGKMIITIMVPQNTLVEDWDNNLLTKAIEEQFDVACEFIFLPHNSSIEFYLPYMMNPEDFPDMIIGSTYITNSITMELAEVGIVTPIDISQCTSKIQPHCV